MLAEEWLVISAAVAGLCVMLPPASRSPALRVAYPPLAIALLLWQLWLRGLHWQLFPALAVILAAALLPWLRLPARLNLAVALSGIVLCIASVAAASLLPLFRLPPPTGPYRVGVRTVFLTDPLTRRQLVTQVWYPTGATRGRVARYARLRELPARYMYQAWIRTNSLEDAPVLAGPHPVLLFSPRWGGRRGQDTFLAEQLASHGYVVAAADHPGNAARIQLQDGSVLYGDRANALDDLPSSAEGQRRWNVELAAWTRDNLFVLASLSHASATPGTWLDGRLDLARAGAFGHSFGGAASLALLGQPQGRPDLSLPAPPPVVRAAVNLDGWTFAGLAHRDAAQAVLLVYGGLPGGVHPDAPAGASVEDQMQAADRDIVEHSLLRYGGTQAWLHGARHNDFTDTTLFSPVQRLAYTGPIAGVRVRGILRSLLLAFFDRTLRQQPVALPAYPELQLDRHPPPPGATPLP